VLAKRYRIVGLLGSGGMGEVYRADDLKLGQPVALKFLPEAMQADSARLDRFLNEVRVALKVTHPNVCRVHDIAELEDQHYISMEYVDGEDLASLLRRIGRLPRDKAVQIACQLCAGLAAAHEQGILHRDLKPANIMIDGRGRAKITDFGLAGWAEAFRGAELGAGTPQYMAPEQRAGKEVTVRSDLYSLGLVLYELFTGKRAFNAGTKEELDRLQEQSTPPTPSSHVEDLDPAVEHVILRCLELDPTQRPASALAVAATLPGGDPLSAALAAGETPSPEMVAAAGPAGGLNPRVAAICLAVAVLGLVVSAAMGDRTGLLGHLPLSKSIEAYGENAREIVSELGYSEQPAYRLAKFEFDLLEFIRVASEHEPGTGWEVLQQPDLGLLRVFYRQYDTDQVPANLGGRITEQDPPNEAGDVALYLDLQGHLTWLRATPERADWSKEPPPEVDWSVVFRAAGLNIENFSETQPTIRPEVFADVRMAWSGASDEAGDRPVRIEAAACRGQPVSFQMITPSHPHWSEEGLGSPWEFEARELFRALIIAALVALGLIFAGAIFLAVRNLKLGRGDRRSALRLAGLVLALWLMGWILYGNHVASFGELEQAVVALSGALALALLIWLLYIALEPYVRRIWPQTLVSWSRLLAGRYRDPLVGRDLLVGIASFLGLGIVSAPFWWASAVFDWIPPIPVVGEGALNGARFAFGTAFGTILVALGATLGAMVAFLLCRIVLRKTWLAAVGFVVVVILMNFTGYLQISGGSIQLAGATLWLVSMAVVAAVAVYLLLRFGLLALVAFNLANQMFQSYPTTIDPSKPYFALGLIGPLIILALATYAFHVSLAGRRLFEDTKSA
jgi:serine/threonine-protein kinase